MRSQKLETAGQNCDWPNKSTVGSMGSMPYTGRANPSSRRATIDREQEQAKDREQEGLLRVGAWHWGFGICEMGWPTGLEPATTRTTIWSSTIELRPPAETLDFSF
jgi:hypothetical protein